MASGASRVISKGIERAAAFPPAAGGMLRRVLELAIDGVGPLPSAKAAAARHLARSEGRIPDAIDSLILAHVGLAGAQGFVTNLGGFAALPIALPANMTGVAVIQARMIATITHLRGYDIMDDRVRTAIVMSMMGGEEIGKRIARGTLPTSPMAIATAPVFDPELDRRVAREVATDLMARVGGKSVAVTVTKRVPILGGGVSAVYDAYSTHQLGHYVKSEFRTRRSIA